MQPFQTILTFSDGPVAILSLNRPEVHHAMNIEMIRELTASVHRLAEEPQIRIIALRAPGDHFSSGADLNWMCEGMNQPEEQLKRESMELAGLFRLICEVPKIFVTSVQGRVSGGANGLVAASDLVVAEKSALFIFPEVRLGLIPATIAPFVVGKIGRSRAAAWMLSGRPFSASEAHSAGLVHLLCEDDMLDQATGKLIQELLSNSPEALRGIKEMIRSFPFQQDPMKIQEETAGIIARYRVSSEGQEGMKAFLEKRKPFWDDSKEF
jgi:methylglutaconyl-CoA hydratase